MKIHPRKWGKGLLERARRNAHDQYPVRTTTRNKDIRPEHVEAALPSVCFVRVPYDDHVTWGFKSQTDLASFTHAFGGKL